MDEKNKQNLDYWRGAGLSLFVKLSSWIVMPILLAVWLGKKLDVKFDSEPKFFLITVGLAFIASIAGMIVSALKEFKKIEAENRNNKNNL